MVRVQFPADAPNPYFNALLHIFKSAETVEGEYLNEFIMSVVVVSNGHLINREISIKQFQDFLMQYSNEHVYCTEHTFFRLSEKQRKLFKCEEIKEILFGQTPVFVGIQNNHNYAVFYKIENQNLIRIVLDIQLKRIDIVTFYKPISKDLPRVGNQ